MGMIGTGKVMMVMVQGRNSRLRSWPASHLPPTTISACTRGRCCPARQPNHWHSLASATKWTITSESWVSSHPVALWCALCVPRCEYHSNESNLSLKLNVVISPSARGIHCMPNEVFELSALAAYRRANSIQIFSSRQYAVPLSSAIDPYYNSWLYARHRLLLNHLSPSGPTRSPTRDG